MEFTNNDLQDQLTSHHSIANYHKNNKVYYSISDIEQVRFID